MINACSLSESCWPAVSFRVSSVWPEDLCRVPGFFLAAGYIALLKLFSQPISLWLEYKYVASILCFHCFFQCDGTGACCWQGCHGYPTCTCLVYFALGLHHPFIPQAHRLLMSLTCSSLSPAVSVYSILIIQLFACLFSSNVCFSLLSLNIFFSLLISMATSHEYQSN